MVCFWSDYIFRILAMTLSSSSNADPATTATSTTTSTPTTTSATTTTTSRDPIADWQAFSANRIPTKGIQLPPLFHQTLEKLEKEKSSLQILELGCGCGVLAQSLQHSGGHCVTGIDVNEQAIAISRQTCGGQGRFLVADVTTTSFNHEDEDSYGYDYDFCILQLLLSIVGGPLERLKTLQNAFSLLRYSGGGTLYLSCSGVSDDINPNYQQLYQQDAAATGEAHSYFSRDTEGKVLYMTHHFTTEELEALLERVGFQEIRIQKHKEASSRRPTEVAYFLYATAVRPPSG
jgi:hypothetical protein